MTFTDDPNLWPYFRPTIIAHDVGRTIDRSTAVVGGNGPFRPPLVGIKEFNELPQGLYGSGRASALAEVDHRYGLTRNSSQTPSVPAIPCGPIGSLWMYTRSWVELAVPTGRTRPDKTNLSTDGSSPYLAN